MADPILRQDAEQLLCKLDTITSIPELNEFRDGLTRYDHREPPAEVVHAIARKRVDLQRNQPKGRKARGA